MSTTAPTVVVGARVAPRYREQLQAIADRNASTISRTAARLLTERLDDLDIEGPTVDGSDRS